MSDHCNTSIEPLFVMYAELRCPYVTMRRAYKLCHICNNYGAGIGLSFVMYAELKCLCVTMRRAYKLCHICNNYDAGLCCRLSCMQS